MLIRIAENRWINTNHIVAVTILYGTDIVVSLLSKTEAAQISVSSLEGKAFMYWLERNSNDIIKHYEGLRKDDNTN